MNRKGFTLIELLGVIIILGILAMITFPVVLNQIKNAKQGIKDSTKTLIIDAAKDYYEDNINNYDMVEGMTYCIDTKTLIDNNYLNKKLKDEKLNDIDTQQQVKMIYHNNKFDYDVTDTCNNNSLTRNNVEVKVVTQGKGLYKSQTEPDRYIYRGGDETNSKVNNFIKLKENGTEVTYRILSFESDGTIKVVRDDSIGGKPFDTVSPRQNTSGEYYCTSSNGCNVWGNQSNTYYNGKTLSELNQDFYFYYYPDNQSINFQIKPSNNFGKVEQNATLNDDLNSTFYNTLDFKNKIDTHSFNVGGLYYYNYFDGYIGGDKGLQKEKEEEQVYIWNGKIAMINITELVETSLSPTCTSVYSNYYHQPNNVTYSNSTYTDKYDEGEWPCSLQNWNYKSSYHQRTLTAASSGRSSVWRMKNSGAFDLIATIGNNTHVRPAFYLKSDVTLTGSGTESDPYKLAGE